VLIRIEGKVSETDGFIVGVAKAGPEFPVILFGDAQDAIAVTGVAGGAGGGEESVVQCGVVPTPATASLQPSSWLEGLRRV
jgi:hypothetical protein